MVVEDNIRRNIYVSCVYDILFYDRDIIVL